MLKLTRRAFAVFALALSFGAAPALAKTGSIHLPSGASMATVGGHVVRGKTQGWRVNGKQGRTFAVTLESTGNAAIMQIREPGKDAGYLPGAGRQDEARTWSGKLPADGSYLIEVIAVQAEADYTLRVEVK